MMRESDCPNRKFWISVLIRAVKTEIPILTTRQNGDLNGRTKKENVVQSIRVSAGCN